MGGKREFLNRAGRLAAHHGRLDRAVHGVVHPHGGVLIDRVVRAGFTDVPGGSAYAQAVAWAVSREITKGTSGNTFSPDSTCTRGGAGSPIARHRNIRISAVVHFLSGENVLGLVPSVIPFPTAHSTACA